MSTGNKIEFGDFQTPLALTREVCSFLVAKGIQPDCILEPTCGLGAFLVAAAEAFPNAHLRGWDINHGYVEAAKSSLAQAGATKRVLLSQQDFFAHDWDTEFLRIRGDILVLGNLPWVTNAVVSGLNGSNLPKKKNFLGFRGIEALTGKSNFDISEWMLIRLVQALRGRPATIAMLCKTATARKLLRFAWQNDGRITKASLHLIDAKKHFGAAVNACLLLVRTSETGANEAEIFEDLAAKCASTTLGLIGQDLVFDIKAYRKLKHLEGLCPYQWRSGVKHDCASVMELLPDDFGILRNKLGEEVNIEPEYLFPLLKCSDLANGRIEPQRFVIVTQRKVGEDTTIIGTKGPRTWHYLNTYRKTFEARKSSIYNNRTPFAIFGIGDYSFAAWKVAVSGLHRDPLFSLIAPVAGKPVLFDDTCYFLPFDDEAEARIVAEILNSQECLEFLTCLTFRDSKRPITVDLLQRLNVHAIAEAAGLAERWSALRNCGVHYSAKPISMQAEFVMERPAL
jgi:hypothetical protein